MKISPFLFVLFICISSVAQKNADPSPEEIKTAKSIREKYDKTKVKKAAQKSRENHFKLQYKYG